MLEFNTPSGTHNDNGGYPFRKIISPTVIGMVAGSGYGVFLQKIAEHQ